MAAEPNKKPEEFSDDEIDQIMDELDKLQEEMDTPEAEGAKAEAGTGDASGESEPALKVVPDVDEALAEAAGLGDDDDILGEFRGSTEDASMEETVGDLGQEETDSGVLAADEPTKEETPEFLSEPEPEPVPEPKPKPEPEPEPELEPPMSTAATRKSSRQTPGQAVSVNQDGCLNMMLTGDIQLKLNYEFGEQEVSIGFEDHCLEVKLTDGTEFKIPLNKK